MNKTAQPAVDADLVVRGLLGFAEQEVGGVRARVAHKLHDPRSAYDKTGRLDQELVEAKRTVRQASARAGYYAMFCPTELGGGGLDSEVFFLAMEALYQRYGPGDDLAYSSVAHWASGPGPLWGFVSPRLAESIRPRVFSGELLGCFGMSEPDAGSDAWRMKTRAVRDGDGWILTGSKQWTSFAPYADYSLVMAVTDPEAAAKRRGGISCFYMPTTADGFAVESVLRMWGDLGGNEAILALNDVNVAGDDLVGEEGRGFDLGMMNVNTGRLYNTARAVGISRWALDMGLKYAASRMTFGKALHDHQSIQNLLADCAVDTYTARCAGLDLARKVTAGLSVRREASMAKLFATNAAARVVDRVLQIHGAMGLTNEVRLYEAVHTTRAARIADGTDEILRQSISRELIKGNSSF